MQHLPLNASVECQDGVVGKSSDVVLNPITRQVTYLVVEEKRAGHLKRLIPVAAISESSSELIQLSCTLEQFEQMDLFEIAHFIHDEMYSGPDSGFILEPYTLPAHYEVVEERIPPGQLAMHRGTAVKATDGKIGVIDEFLVDPNDGHISHIVLRERHLLRKQEHTLPISAIDRVAENIVFLKLTKKQVEDLPTVPQRPRET